MIETLLDFREHAFLAAANVVLALAILAAMYRIVVGPSLADRVIALDLLGFFSAGIISVYALQTEQTGLISVAIVLALILFLGTAAFALYLERAATVSQLTTPRRSGS